jgi:carbonic anhydrase
MTDNADVAGFPPQLLEGYRTFSENRLPRERERFGELAASGQKPKVMLIGCCDSRVSPEVIFDARPGEIFVVRNVANLIPPYEPGDEHQHGTSAALEFAVMGLRVEHIVVMGHALCGGVRAFAENESDPYTRPLSPGDFIGRWIKLIAPAAEAIGPGSHDDESYVERLGMASVENSIANLLTFPCVRTLVERKRLFIHGAYFGVTTGRLRILNPATGQFEPYGPGPDGRFSLMHCG